MKAILVVDVDEKDLNNEVTIIKLANDTAYYFSNKRLKPMPQMKYSIECRDSDGNKWEEPSEYDIGYNTCIEELLREEE